MFQAYGKPITAKVFTDIDQVENLLVNEEIELHKGRGNAKRENGMDDDDGHLGGMDDDFEMPCSAQTNEPFFTQNGHEFAQSQQTDGINVGNDLMHLPDSYGELQRLDGENLIQAPLQVNALNIEYAKTSKNIDVRKLKQVIWSLLCATDDKVMEFGRIFIGFFFDRKIFKFFIEISKIFIKDLKIFWYFTFFRS